MKRGEQPKDKARARYEVPSFLVVCALALLVVASYWPVLGCGFVNFDDPDYITANDMVRRGLSLNGFQWAFVTGHMGSWHPVTWISHMLDCQLFGLNPAGHHAVNLLFHLFSSLVLFHLLRQTTGTFWRSAMVAALFALHPTHVESVAWVSERKDVLSVFFGLLSLVCYTSYTRSAPEKLRRFYVLAFVLFVASLMSKPMLVTLPLVFLLFDVWPLARFSPVSVKTDLSRVKSLIVEKLPFFAVSVLFAAITFTTQHKAGAVRDGQVFTLSERMSGVAVNYVHYLGKLFWPVDLSVIYPARHHLAVTIILSFVCLGLGLGYAIWESRRRPWLTIGSLWFVTTLIPVIGFITIGHHSIADRYTYLPSIGLFIVLSWAFGELVAAHRFGKTATVLCAGLAVTSCCLLTHAQTRHWTDSKNLFTHAIAVTENNFVAHSNLGFLAQEKGDFQQALRHFDTALKYNPNDPDLLNNRAATLMGMGRLEEAVDQFQSTLHLHPKSAQTHLNYGRALLAQRKPSEALEEFRTAISLDQNLVAAHLNYADIAMGMGQLNDALAHYRDAVKIQPSNAEALTKLGSALADSGRTEEGLKHLRAAVNLRPNWETALNNLAWALATIGDSDQSSCSEALRLGLHANEITGGQHAPVLDTLAACYAANGNFVEAIATAKKAIECAEAAGQIRLAADAQSHLNHYLAHKPFRIGQGSTSIPPAK